MPRSVSSEEPYRPGIVLVDPLGVGGVTDYTTQLARSLAERGHLVDFVTGTDHTHDPTPGVQVHALVVWERGRTRCGRLLRRAGLAPAANALRFVRVIPSIVRLARRRGILHIQGSYFLPLYAVLVAAARLARVPVVSTPQNFFDRSGPRFGVVRTLVFRASQAIVLHVQSEVELLPTAARERAAVIPVGNFRDIAKTGQGMGKEAAKRSLGLDERRVVALLFGQLRPDKGIIDLLAAAELVPDLAVLIAGQEAGGLAAASDALSAPALNDRLVVREGYLPMSEVATMFGAADVAVYAYPYASQSAAVMLAYGFDTPIVVYPVGGLPDLVEVGRTGWITKRPDVPALIETLREVTALGAVECKRRGLAGGRLADARYSWNAIATRHSEVYRRIAFPVDRTRQRRRPRACFVEGVDDAATPRSGCTHKFRFGTVWRLLQHNIGRTTSMRFLLSRVRARTSDVTTFLVDSTITRRRETLAVYARLCVLCMFVPRSTRPVRMFGVRVHHGSLTQLRQLYQEVFLGRAYAAYAPTTARRILDAGANIGLATLYYKLNYPQAEIVCFEPDPMTFALLERTVRVNGLTGITLRNMALADHDGEETLYYDSDTLGGDPTSTLLRSFRESVGDATYVASATVPCTRLSRELAEPVDILKLDIEGSEGLVLAEAAKLLGQVGTIQMEHHSIPGNDLRAILDLLRGAQMDYWLHEGQLPDLAVSVGMVYARPKKAPEGGCP